MLVQDGDDHTVDGDDADVLGKLSPVRRIVVVQQLVILGVDARDVDARDLRLELREFLLFGGDLPFEILHLFVGGHHAVEVHHAHKQDDRKHQQQDLVSCRESEVKVHCATSASASAAQSMPKRSVKPNGSSTMLPSSSSVGSGLGGRPG